MAVTKLRADAPPFLFPPPPSPQCMAASPYNPAVSPPPSHFAPSYTFVRFHVPPPRPIYGFPPPPPPHPAVMGTAFIGTVVVTSQIKATLPFLGSNGPSLPSLTPQVPLISKDVPSPRAPPPIEPVSLSSKDAPLPPPTAPTEPVSSSIKDAFSPPPLVSLSSMDAPSLPLAAPLCSHVLPHGSAPHKLIRGVVAKKLEEKAATADMARAPEPVKPGKVVLVSAPVAAPPTPPCLLREKQQATERGRGKVVGPRLAKAPVESACKPEARSPSPAFTTSPPSLMPAPEWRKRQVTTVMIRNIPNRLKPCEMMQLLDEHCARTNSKTKKNPLLVAYDFLYLPMDFRNCSCNMGYAFVNLTTPESARGLHYALHGARWKVHGTKKVIDIRAARIQGMDALVRRFSGSTFPCHTDEYLPATFSPPRDGTAGKMSSVGKYVGNRVHTPAPTPQPLPVAPAPKQQQLAWRPVGEAKLQAPSS